MLQPRLEIGIAGGPVLRPDGIDLRPALLEGLEAGAAFVHREARLNVSGRVVRPFTRRLLRGIAITEARVISNGAIAIVSTSPEAFYGRFLDRGARAHAVNRGARTTRAARPGRRAERARRGFGRARLHPGITPRRWLTGPVEVADRVIRPVIDAAIERRFRGLPR